MSLYILGLTEKQRELLTRVVDDYIFCSLGEVNGDEDIAKSLMDKLERLRVTSISVILGIDCSCLTSQVLLQLEHDWNAFYKEPTKYSNTVVVDLIKEWYKERWEDK